MGEIALHPLNDRFTWRSAPTELRRLTHGQTTRFDDDGYLLYPGAFDADTVARTIAAIDPLEAQAEAHLRSQPDGKLFISKADAITFAIHLVTRSAELRALSCHPLITDLCHDLVGPNVRLYWDQSVYKKPSNPDEFPFHQDNGYTFISPQQYLTCWVALTDTDETNGCPWVVPGMHHHGTLAHELTPLGWQCMEDSPDAVPVPASAGDIVIFSSLTPHRTGPNLTDQVRKSYILQYAADGTRLQASRHKDPDLDHDPLQNDPDRQYFVLRDGQRVVHG
ncbi:MAG: phytanoyl-CoA dioxygenase family protein [Actinomycetota bacterium]|jgi:phytanoyl-CoA hydroxylase|nr:phytanoyl-CoA dioxygenase family protein [Actinomycetota bacterium]